MNRSMTGCEEVAAMFGVTLKTGRNSKPKPKPTALDSAALTELATIVQGLTRPADLARVIKTYWPEVYFGAVPYLNAMGALESFNADYGNDSGKEIGLYFLANAQTWRGDVAKLVKVRIKELLK